MDESSPLPHPHHKKVLDHGFVELVGISIDFADLVETQAPDDLAANYQLPRYLDSMIARAARTSYTAGTKKISDDDRLIDRLMRDQHTSPFEQIDFKFLIRAPLFVVQQLLRHRTASLNQESARYSVIKDETYMPIQMRSQHATNKQMSGAYFEGLENQQLRYHLRESYDSSFENYETLLDAGVAREQARMVLPHGTYTQLVWKMDLHNLLHFLALRLDPHAQQEIREYAQAILALIEPLVPVTIKHWRNHVLNGQRFSQDELEVIKFLFHQWVTRNVGADETFDEALPDIAHTIMALGVPPHRVVELANKLELPELTADHVKRAKEAV